MGQTAATNIAKYGMERCARIRVLLSHFTFMASNDPIHSRWEQRLQQVTKNTQIDSRRVFHGRGGCYPGWEGVCLDCFHPLLLLTFFNKTSAVDEQALIEYLSEALKTHAYQSLLVQRRYEEGSPIECVWGEFPEQAYAQRKSQRYTLNFNQQNVGFFLDMEPGRQWLEQRAQSKKVLNLFSYTCAFSVVAAAGGAQSVLNVDMSSRALSTGRENHRCNELGHCEVKYQALDILKSWGRIRKGGPYDIIIIDPPSAQKGSFLAERDYKKVVRRLNELSGNHAEVLACLNAPHLGEAFLRDTFAEHAPDWKFVERLPGHEDFPDISDDARLKLIHFEK